VSPIFAPTLVRRMEVFGETRGTISSVAVLVRDLATSFYLSGSFSPRQS